MLYKEWIDFVSFPLDPQKCQSREQRLDLSEAIDPFSSDYTPELGTEKGAIVSKRIIFFDGDKFEAMTINDSGDVCIWTEKRVWTLLRRFGGIEKLIYVSRHPDMAGLV